MVFSGVKACPTQPMIPLFLYIQYIVIDVENKDSPHPPSPEYEYPPHHSDITFTLG